MLERAADPSADAEGFLRAALDELPAVVYVESPAAPTIRRWWSAGILDLTGLAASDFDADPTLWASLRLDRPATQRNGLGRPERGLDEYRIRGRDGEVRTIREHWLTSSTGARLGVIVDLHESPAVLDLAATARAVAGRATTGRATGGRTAPGHATAGGASVSLAAAGPAGTPRVGAGPAGTSQVAVHRAPRAANSRLASSRGARQGATRDALTGLHDRRSLHRRLERLTAKGISVGLLILDLDRFREVNDSLGHAMGDLLLASVAGRLVRTVRPADMVVRLGGDEFGVLLPSTEPDQAMEMAWSIERALERPFAVDGHTIALAASIGVTAGRGDAEQLLRESDQAMVVAKGQRRGVVLFDPGLQGSSEAGYSRLPELRRAIERAELVLHYQPWLGLSDDRTDVVEALVRWQHPTRGLLPPAAFLPLAEESGLIREIDVLVLELACRQIAAWQDQGIRPRVAVNLSRPSLLSEDFPSILAATLIRHRLEGPEIELEITENGVLGDPEQAAWLAERLTALGVRLSIDDFGTGYSSLGQLRRMGVSTLKIDRSFVRDVIVSEDDRAIVETVVALGHRLGLQVVAEGVEDRATLDYLREIDVDYAQGFVISRPVPPDVLVAWLTDLTVQAARWPAPADGDHP